ELRRHLAAHFVTAAADPRADPGADVAAAVLVTHEARRGGGHPGLRPPPARVDQAGDALLRVPQHDRVAIGVGGEDGDAGAVGEQSVDVVDGAAGLVDPGHLRAV